MAKKKENRAAIELTIDHLLRLIWHGTHFASWQFTAGRTDRKKETAERWAGTGIISLVALRDPPDGLYFKFTEISSTLRTFCGSNGPRILQQFLEMVAKDAPGANADYRSRDLAIKQLSRHKKIT